MKKISKGARRISDADVVQMVRELDRWSQGHLGSKLTWAILEKRFGFSRQSLQGKLAVKVAYNTAKAALASGIVQSKRKISDDNGELKREVERLEKMLQLWEQRDIRWKQRYQRIAFHIRQNGTHLYDVDREIPNGSRVPGEREVADILRPFDKEIPPSGRK